MLSEPIQRFKLSWCCSSWVYNFPSPYFALFEGLHVDIGNNTEIVVTAFEGEPKIFVFSRRCCQYIALRRDDLKRHHIVTDKAITRDEEGYTT